tara:strand:+ start:1626 stop:1760 length:135 start_codon:yes stop_codon:yes gene_type:complete
MKKKFKVKVKGEDLEVDLEDKDYVLAVLLEKLNNKLERLAVNGR